MRTEDDIIGACLQYAYASGQAQRALPVYAPRGLIHSLNEGGYEIVPVQKAPLVEGATYELTPEGSAAIEAFVQSVPLSQEAISAGGAALEREFDAKPDRYIRAVPGLSERDVVASFEEPLDAVPDEIADQRAEAVRRVIQANRLLAEAVAVLGPEAVALMMHNLAAPDLTEAA